MTGRRENTFIVGGAKSLKALPHWWREMGGTGYKCRDRSTIAVFELARGADARDVFKGRIIFIVAGLYDEACAVLDGLLSVEAVP